MRIKTIELPIFDPRFDPKDHFCYPVIMQSCHSLVYKNVHFLVDRYVFDGAKIMMSSKRANNERSLFYDGARRIVISQQERSIEASSVTWKFFDQYYKAVSNNDINIFNQIGTIPIMKEAEGLLLNNREVVALSDIK